MFSLIKGIIWLVGFVVVAIFVLNYFGYEVNYNYFTESKAECQKRVEDCAKEFVEQGTKNAECDFDCVNPRILIKKK
ncbi:MAG: hypothetical protein ACOYS2_01450 [Patescibacteria group bacterium]